MEEGDCDVESKLWYRKKNWQTQLFALSHGMNEKVEKVIAERKSKTIFII